MKELVVLLQVHVKDKFAGKQMRVGIVVTTIILHTTAKTIAKMGKDAGIGKRLDVGEQKRVAAVAMRLNTIAQATAKMNKDVGIEKRLDVVEQMLVGDAMTNREMSVVEAKAKETTIVFKSVTK
jgi:hypothetical protein